MDAIETFEHAGLKVEIHQDIDATSPADWDNLGTLVAFPRLSRNYSFAERESTGTEDDALDRGGFRLVKRYLSLTEGAYALAFDFYEHGPQCSLSSTSDDDNSVAGFILTTPDRIKQLCGEDEKYLEPEWVEKALNQELRVWRQYVEGDVYGYVIETDAPILGDSCWGFYGFDYCVEEAKEAAEYLAEEIAKSQLQLNRGRTALIRSLR